MLTFEELYVSYSPDVYRFSVWLCGNTDDAEDITAETFARAWLNFAAIRTETLKGYLFTIARNLYLESRRKQRPQEELTDVHPDLNPPLERNLESQSELDQIRATLLTLPEVDRSAFVLRVQYDLAYDEIARILKTSEGAVKVKVHRIRKLLFAVHSNKETP